MKARWKRPAAMAALAGVVLALLYWFVPFRRSVDGNFRLPEDTGVILVSQTWESGYDLLAVPRTALFFLDREGQKLGHIRFRENEYGRFLVEHGGDVCLFLRNESVLMGKNRLTKFSAYDESAASASKRFGPSAVGRIEELGLSYAVRDGLGPVGAELRSGIRFVSDDGSASYDVLLPGHYIAQVCYAPERKSLVCAADAPLTYMELTYDEALGRFVYDGALLPLKNDALPEDADSCGLLVKDNFLFHLTLLWDEGKGTYTPILSKYDLDTGACVLNQAICEGYSQGGYGGGGYLVGSSDLPVTVRNGKLYFFARDGHVYIIGDEDHIEARPMPYTFQNTKPVDAPWSGARRGDSFYDTVVRVGNEGEIYVLVLFADKGLKIFRLEDGGEYSVFWAGSLPWESFPDLGITDFVLVTD